ncbi:undecaprenyl-diphosphate phosphatase [Rosenbergiella australiborealis]|uniref:undecaprenyl-diphosphate phosphatase n=1 Tax=Rosenbergiella australiborealis TaxID=1544696 RepID=A0ABS5T3S9_9GAMM|nr:undecaprenyl-diphosphate phosphatase [Rosenbergiella australiborealis]MBT0726986.1 undecaprenyl-diphosphate phosphatase [Rosenbergiella australiborealis]
MEQLNTQLFLWLNATPDSPRWLINLAIILAKDVIGIIPLVVVCLWLWSPKNLIESRRELVLKTITALLYAIIFSSIIGVLYPHPRPFAIGLGYQWINHSPDTSYPSDHGTFIFTFSLAFMCWHRLWSGLVLLVIGMLIAWSRIYLGVHWPLDMLGGLLVGMIGCLTAQFGWKFYGNALLNIVHKLYRQLFALPIRRGWTQH